MSAPDIDKILELGGQAKLKMYHSMLAKISAGGTLTAAELKTFDVLETEIKQQQEDDEAKSKRSSGNLILSTKDTAAFFDVTTRTIQNWAKAGCPNMGRGSWDLKAVNAWWLENIWLDRAVSEAGDESINEAKRLYWWQKAHGEEIKNKRARGDLVSWDEIDAEWSSRVAAVTSGLASLEYRLPPMLEGKSRREMQDAIHGEVRRMRDAYARRGKYSPSAKAAKAKKHSA